MRLLGKVADAGGWTVGLGAIGLDSAEFVLCCSDRLGGGDALVSEGGRIPERTMDGEMIPDLL